MTCRELNHKEIDDLQQLTGKGSLFLSPPWISSIPNAKVVGLFSKSGILSGGFIFATTKLKGLKALIDPPFTPHVALFTDQSFPSEVKRHKYEKSIADGIIEYLKVQQVKVIHIHLPPDFSFVQPFIWAGYQVAPRFTYQIDLEQDEEALFSNMSGDMRNLIRRTGQEGYEEVSDVTAEEVSEAVLNTLKGNEVKGPLEVLPVLIERTLSDGSAFVTCVESNEVGRSYAFCAHDDHTCYYLFGAGPLEKRDGAAGRINLWNAILTAKAKGLSTFDFEGSMIPEIERFFRGFGGKLVGYQGVSLMPEWVRVAAKITGKKFT